MAFADNEALLADYNQWVAERKVVGIDTTPTAYLVDKAKEAAYEKVVNIEEYAKGLISGDYSEDDSVDIGEYLLKILED